MLKRGTLAWALNIWLVFLVVLPRPCVGQATNANDNDMAFATSLGVLTANSLLGGLSASIRAALEGNRDFGRVFVRGALGGGVAFAGKRLAVEDWYLAPALGRAVNAAGASITVQASGSGGVFDSIQVPVGPISLHFSRSGGFKLSLDIHDTVLLTSGLLSRKLELNTELSMRALTPVFETRGYRINASGRFASGATRARVIVLDGVNPFSESTFGHEVVHLLQYDFLQITWGQPIERALRRNLLGSRQPPDWLLGGFVVPLIRELDGRLNNRRGYIKELAESEAEWLEKRCC